MTDDITYMLAGSYVEARHVARAQKLTGDGRTLTGERPWLYWASPDMVSGVHIHADQVARCYGYYERRDYEQFEDNLRYVIVKRKDPA